MTSGPEPTPSAQTYTVRRAPRLSAVLTAASLLALVAAAVATVIEHAGPEPVLDAMSGESVTAASTFGVLALGFLLGANVLALLVWLLLDRRSRATERTVVLEPTDDPALADVSLDRREAQALRARAAAPADEETTAVPASADAAAERTSRP